MSGMKEHGRQRYSGRTMGRRERKGSPVLPEYISASGREPGDLLCFRQLLGMLLLNERESFSQTCRICPAKEGLSRDRVFLRGKDALLAHIVIRARPARAVFPMPFFCELTLRLDTNSRSLFKPVTPARRGPPIPRVSNEKIIKRPPRHELRSFAKPVMPARRGPCLCRASCGDGSRQ